MWICSFSSVDVNKTVVSSLAIGRKHEAIAESTVEIPSQDIGVIRAYCCNYYYKLDLGRLHHKCNRLRLFWKQSRLHFSWNIFRKETKFICLNWCKHVFRQNVIWNYESLRRKHRKKRKVTFIVYPEVCAVNKHFKHWVDEMIFESIVIVDKHIRFQTFHQSNSIYSVWILIQQP